MNSSRRVYAIAKLHLFYASFSLVPRKCFFFLLKTSKEKNKKKKRLKKKKEKKRKYVGETHKGMKIKSFKGECSAKLLIIFRPFEICHSVITERFYTVL